jgi:hypothetical protein
MSDADKKVDEALAHILESAVKGSDFLVEQAPLVVQDIINFGRVWCPLGILGGVVLVFIACYVLCSERRRDMYDFGAGMVAFAVGIGGLAWIGCSTYWTILAWCAPRLYVLEHLKGLL